MKNTPKEKEDLAKFSLRILTGIILILITLFLTYKGDFYFFILIFVFAFFSLFEFLKILYNSGYILKPNIIFFINILFLPFLTFFQEKDIFLLFFLILIYFFISLFFAEKRKGFMFFSSSLVSIFYIILPALFFYNIRKDFGFKEVIFLFGVVWFFDSFSFFCGKFFGKRKLWERVSKNKTIEGTVGGFVFAILFSMIFSLFTNANIYERVLTSVFISVFAFLGDLWESMFKREMGIKDSSSLLPGHGGFLDRIDSLLISIYFYYFYLILFNPGVP